MPHHPVDVHVGNRVRVRRILLGLNQTQLGEALGLTFQQVQKYERGGNRISASRLYQIGVTLGVPVESFFEDIPEEAAEFGAPQVEEPGSKARREADPMQRRETLELMRSYNRIGDPTVRRQIEQMIKALAKAAS